MGVQHLIIRKDNKTMFELGKTFFGKITMKKKEQIRKVDSAVSIWHFHFLDFQVFTNDKLTTGITYPSEYSKNPVEFSHVNIVKLQFLDENKLKKALFRFIDDKEYIDILAKKLIDFAGKEIVYLVDDYNHDELIWALEKEHNYKVTSSRFISDSSV